MNLDRWVTEGVEPPASRHPRVDDGTAVPPDALAKAFARIPGAQYPAPPRPPAPARLRRRSGAARDDADPAARGPAFGSLVSAVDDDGNEVAGITLPEVRVPVAAHTGWTLRHPDIGGAEQLLVFAGAHHPLCPHAA